jgi:hypothetical protein
VLHSDENSSIGMDYAVPDVEPRLPVPIPIEQPSESMPDFTAAARPAPAPPARSGSGRNPLPSGRNAAVSVGARPPARAKGSGTAPIAIAAIAGVVVLGGLLAFLVMRRGGEPAKPLARADGAPAPAAGSAADGPVGVTLGTGERPPGDLFDDPPGRGGSGGASTGSGGPVEIDPIPPLTKRTEPAPKAAPPEPDPPPVEDEVSKMGEAFGRLTFALGDSMPRNPRKLLRECNAFLESLKRSRHPRAAEFRAEFEKALAKFNRDIAAGNAQLAELFQPEGIRRQLASLEGADANARRQTREDLLDVSDPPQVAVFYEELISNPKPTIRAECADIIAERKDPSGAAALFVALQTEQDATVKGAVLSALQRMTGRTLAADDVNGWKNYFRAQS